MASPAPAQILAAMAQTNELFNTEVVGKRNFAALDDIYTTNARVLPPGGPMISGRQAIRQFWSDLVTTTNATSAVLTTVEVNQAGPGAVEIGRATLTFAPEGQLDVKYVVHWREEDGRWKWDIDIWNTNQ